MINYDIVILFKIIFFVSIYGKEKIYIIYVVYVEYIYFEMLDDVLYKFYLRDNNCGIFFLCINSFWCSRKII